MSLRIIIAILMLILVVVLGFAYYTNYNRWTDACVRQSGHVGYVHHTKVCLSPDGRVINLKQ